MKSQVDTMMRAMRAAQLGDSSIENGALVIFDEFGLERLRLGNQGDGTFVSASLNNPNPPPVPNMPIVEPGTGLLKVTSAGFVGAVPVPSDFAYYTVYTAPQGQTDRADGTITTDPGSWIIDTGTQYVPHTVWLTATNLSGKESQPSEVNSATPTKVVSDAILEGAVTELQLAADAVTAAKVRAGEIGTAKFADAAVTLSKLADGSVNGAKLLGGVVTSDKIAANAIAAGQIAAGAILAGNLAAQSVTAVELATNSVTTIKLAADSVAAGRIAADAVTSRELLALSVTSNAIAANAVTAGHITAGAVTASKLEATMIITTRMLAGTPTGTRAEVNGSGFEAWKGTIRTFQVNAATGDVMVLGAYKTAAAGTRIEFGGTVGADTMRFYPSTGSSSARIDSFPDGTNAGILMQASGATSSTRVSTMFLRTGYASLGFADLELDTLSEFYAEPNFVRCRSATVDLIVDRAITPSGGARRVAFIHYNTAGGAEGGAHLNYQEATNGTPWLWGVNRNCGLKFDQGGLAATAGGSEVFGPISASAFPVGSSELSKENVTDVAVASDRTAWDIIEGAPAFDWNYIGENNRGPYPTNPDGSRVAYRDPDGTVRYSEWDFPPPPNKRHRFPLAEDLAVLDPNLVLPSDNPASTSVDIRDAIGTLWDAVDMLIKRTRVYDDLIAQYIPKVTIPPRPQRGDVVTGAGAVKPGRTKRDIDPVTKQDRKRRSQT